MRSPLLFFALFVLPGFLAYAQPFAREVEPFPVLANGSPIVLPFAGGVNSPLHQFVDIDADGDYDLFVFDNDLGMDFYRNEGTRFLSRFAHHSELISIPTFLIWFRFVDYDGDGKIDLCTEDSTFQGVRVFKNTGTHLSPQFSEIISTLKDTSGADVYTGGNSIPVFVDIDADGDPEVEVAAAGGRLEEVREPSRRGAGRFAEGLDHLPDAHRGDGQA